MHGLKGYKLLFSEISSTIEVAKQHTALASYSKQLALSLTILNDTTMHLLKRMQTDNIDKVLANSVLYLSTFGHVVISWIWLKQGYYCRASVSRRHSSK